MSLSTCFRHGFGEVGEDHREPQPEGDLNAEEKSAGFRNGIFDHENGCQRGSDLNDEHHRILCNHPWIQFDE